MYRHAWSSKLRAADAKERALGHTSGKAEESTGAHFLLKSSKVRKRIWAIFGCTSNQQPIM